MIHNNLSNVSWRGAAAYGNAAAWGRARNQQNALFAQNVATQTMKTAVREQEESPLAKKMKEMHQALKRLQQEAITPTQARKRAAQQKIVSLRDRVRLLQGSLANSGGISKGRAKSAARELKELARQLAAAVRELKGSSGGDGGGGVDLGAIAAAAGGAGAGETAAAQGEGGAAGAGDEGAQQAAAQAEQAAREAEQQAQEGAQSAERASDEAQAANGQAQAVDENRPAAPTQGKGEDSPDGGMGEMIKEIKQGLRNAANLLRARLHESQRRELKELNKMDADELSDAIGAMYGGDGASVGLESALGALLHEQA